MILLISPDNDFLEEQLLIEGLGGLIIQSRKPEDIAASEPNLIIINNLSSSDDIYRPIIEYIKKGGRVIMVKPCSVLMEEMGFHKIKEYQDGYLIPLPLFSEDCLVQISSVDIYSLDNTKGWYFWDGSNNTKKYSIIFEEEIGQGKLILITFDLINTLYSLTHGKDIVLSRNNSVEGVPRVDLGRKVEAYLRLHPQADILRRILIYLLEKNLPYPLPRIWYFPWHKQAAIAITHDSDNVSQDTLETVTQLDKVLGIESTLFLRIFDGQLWKWRVLEQYGANIQFHPVFLYHHHPPKIIRAIQEVIGSSRPVMWAQKGFFMAQKKLLELCLGKKLTGVRNHGLIWNRLTDQPCWMSRSGIKFDSTLGSNYYWGYMYGSGLPYFLRTPDTLKNLDILEIPLHIMDSSILWEYKSHKKPFDQALPDVLQFIDNAATVHPSLIVINLHYYCLKNNDKNLNNLDFYHAIIQRAKEKDLLFTSIISFHDYWRKRLKTKISDYCWNSRKREVSFRVDNPEGIEGLSYILPAKFQQLTLKDINRIPNDSSESKINLGIQEYFLGAVPPTGQQDIIKATYG
jgi:hypothetical protein